MKCKYCGKDRIITDFGIARVITGKTYRRKKCSICINLDKKARRERARQYIQEVRNSSECKICGESHPAVLDFHHRDEKSKEICISNGTMWSIERLQKEIDKCDVLCANCHRKLHWKEKK